MIERLSVAPIQGLQLSTDLVAVQAEALTVLSIKQLAESRDAGFGPCMGADALAFEAITVRDRFVGVNELVTDFSMYEKRRGIVPCSPALLRLGDALKTGRCTVERARPVFASVDLLNQKAVFDPVTITFEDGRVKEIPPPDGVTAGATELDRICAEISAAERCVRKIAAVCGSSYVWTRRPNMKTCEMLADALTRGEVDAEDFLCWFVRSQLGRGKRLDPYVAFVLWLTDLEMNTNLETKGSPIWATCADHEVYRRVNASASKCMREDAEKDPTKLRGLRRVPLAATPELTDDPFAFLFSGEPIDLRVAAEMIREKLEEVRDFGGCGLTLTESRYALFVMVRGLSATEAQKLLGLSAAEFRQVRRSANQKIASAGRTAIPATRPREWFGHVSRPVNRTDVMTIVRDVHD